MTDRGRTRAARLRPDRGRARGLSVALVLMALGFLLSGCGNCGGWTNPWYKATAPGACSSDGAPKQAVFAPLAE